jgi:hypothetical protein
MATISNAPESDGLTLQDVEIFENARQAVSTLKKTFEMWMVIATAVAWARDMADRRGGRQTFRLILEQQDLGMIDKATASRLLRIHEHYPEVVKWRNTLTPARQLDWASPTSVVQRCPAFKPPKAPSDEPKPLTKAEQTAQELAKALEKIHQLEKRGPGDRFEPTEPINDIAKALFGTFQGFPHDKGEKVAKMWLKLIADAKAKRERQTAA